MPTAHLAFTADVQASIDADRVVAVDGDRRVNGASLAWHLDRLGIGREYGLGVVRDGREREVRLEVAAGTRPGWQWAAAARAFVALAAPPPPRLRSNRRNWV